MTMCIRLTSFFFILFAISTTSIAQGDFRKGYIVKNNLDTIHGLIDYRSKWINGKYCLFRESRSSKIIRYSPSELYGYTFEGDKYYVSKNLPVDTIKNELGFAEILVGGNATLMVYGSIYYIKMDRIYKLPRKRENRVVIESGKGAREMKDLRYRYLTNYLFRDCELAANQDSYNKRDFIKRVTAYNLCKGNLIPMEYKIPAIQASLTFFGGVDRSTLKLEKSGYVGSETNTSTTWGGGIDLLFPRISRKLMISVEFLTMNKEYQPYKEPTVTYGGLYDIHTQYDILVKTSIVKFPISIGYNFFPGNNTPYVKVGMVNYRFKTTAESTTEHERNYIVTTDYEQHKESNSENGYWLAFGYNHVVFGKLRVFAEVRSENLSGVYGDFESANLVSLSGLTGIKFKL